MNPAEQDKLLALLATALERTAAPEPHVADDPELITAWLFDELAPEARRSTAAHLAACASCRARLADLADAHSAELATAHTAERKAEPAPTARRRFAPAALAALAAGLLLAGGWFVLTRDSAGREVARAEREIADGHPLDALARLEQMPAGRPGSPDATRRSATAERAAHAAARDALAAGNFDEVARVRDRSRALGADSGRLAALDLQAQRREPHEVAFAARGTLLDWGVQPTGRPGPLKSVGQQPALEAAFRAAVAEHPNDPTLLANFGAFLLSVGARGAEIDGVFARAVAADPKLVSAHLGRGIVAFREKQYASALGHFRQAEALTPESPEVLINLAICFEQKGDRAEARLLWTRAEAATTAPALRTVIAQHLKGD